MHNQTFRLKPSRYYLYALSVVTVLALYSLHQLSLPLFLKIVIALMVVFYSAWTLSQHGLLITRNAIQSIEYKGEGIWLVTSTSETYHATLASDSTVTNLVSVLRFIMPNRYRAQTCLIFSDALSREQYHQLIMILKMFKL